MSKEPLDSPSIGTVNDWTVGVVPHVAVRREYRSRQSLHVSLSYPRARGRRHDGAIRGHGQLGENDR